MEMRMTRSNNSEEEDAVRMKEDLSKVRIYFKSTEKFV